MGFPEQDLRRWAMELRELQARHLKILSLAKEPLATVDGLVKTTAGTRRYRMVWPPDFPLRPPSIWELTPDGSGVVDHRDHGYVFADGSLCLFAHTPEHGWRPDFTGAFAVERFAEYVNAEHTNPFPRLENVPRELDVMRVSIRPGLVQALREGGRWGALNGHLRDDVRLILVTGADGTGSKHIVFARTDDPPPEPWVTALGCTLPWNGMWCRVDEGPEAAPPSREEFLAWIDRHTPTPEAREFLRKTPAVLLVQKSALWFVAMHPPELVQSAFRELKIPFVFTRPIVEDIAAKIFRRVDDLLQDGQRLRAARAAIIGSGSLGSVVAIALAKAGVGRFVLFDPERLEPENIARHIGSVRDIGRAKVEVVRDAIHRINPEAEILPLAVPVSLDPRVWAGDPIRYFKEVLVDPRGIVICTTATADAERIVNALAVSTGAPAVFAAVLGRAQHGRIFRVVPGLTACYECVLAAQAEDPGRFPKFEGRELGVPGYHQPGVPGLGIDVDQVALIAARLALQTLASRLEGGIGYPECHGDHFLWSNHGGWAAVDGPLQACVERIPRRSECAICGERRAEPLCAAEEAELTNLEQLAQA